MVPKQKKAPDTAIRGRPIRGRLKALTRLAGVAAGPRDPVFTLYRTLLAYGAVAILILLAGAAEFIYFEPFGKPAGVTVHIAGVYRYDPTTHKTFGPDRLQPSSTGQGFRIRSLSRPSGTTLSRM